MVQFLALHRVKSWMMRHDPDPPHVAEAIPDPQSLLMPWPESHIQWVSTAQIARFDPVSRCITLSRAWTEGSPCVAAHVIAHERSHADQSPLWAWLAGWHILFAVLWGCLSGWLALWWPPVIAIGALAQWLWDFLVRQRLEGDADERAVQRLISVLPFESDQQCVRDWAYRLARRHRWALAIEGLGWSGLTIVMAVMVVSGLRWIGG